MLPQNRKEDILRKLKPDIDDANGYYRHRLEPHYLERAKVMEASPEYYNAKFPKLGKIPLTTSEAYDTVMWIMPSLVELFSSGEDVVTVQGQGGEDSARAAKLQKLLNYQTDRLNDGFMDRYFWMKSALDMNIGFLKISWLQKRETRRRAAALDREGLAALQAAPAVKIIAVRETSPGGFDMPATYQVDYEEEAVTENRPLIELVPVTEVRWASNTKKLKDSQFVMHVKKVALDHLYQKERDGVYFDIDKVKEQAAAKAGSDTVEQYNRDQVKEIQYDADDLRREITIYECYARYPLDEAGQDARRLHDWVFTVAEGPILIGAQFNTMGRRHPFVALTAYPDPWDVVPRKGLVELLAEVQHINTALIRLFIKHLIRSNEGRRFVDKTRVDQDDLFNEAEDIGVEGDPRTAVYQVPMMQLSPLTMPFFELMQSKVESTVGVTKYNTGTDAASLNPTATGVTALIDQANKKIRLIARIMAETGYTELYRFLITLNQKYPAHKQYIRLLNEDLEIDPSDLDGKYDLIVNVGLGSADKQAEIQTTQLIMGVLEKIGGLFPGSVTYDKAYNLVKMLLEQLGRKNVDDFLNDPRIQRQMQMQLQGGMNSGIPGAEGLPPESGGGAGPGGAGGPALPGPGYPGTAPGDI